MSPNKIFMFLINLPSENVKLQKMIAERIFECFEKMESGRRQSYTRTQLINNLLVTCIFVVSTF